MPENTIIVDETHIENDLVRVDIDELGEVVSIFDKVNMCELTTGHCNRMRMYQDIPSAFDAWDIDSMYRLTPVELPGKAEIEVVGQGPLFGSLVIRRKLHNSMMTQTIRLEREARRVDFHTVIDWQERHKLLKVDFPVDYHVPQALHEIQFGHLARPTHRSREIDRDRFEVSNHKWTALVEANRGFAVLNDSKYGVSVLDDTISLTLLKSALAPDMTADLGHQEFTYGFYFWDEPLIKSGIVQQGYALNKAPLMMPGKANRRSLFEVDQDNIIIDTIKPSEDQGSRDIVMRLYESMGTQTAVQLKSSLPIMQVFETDMLEQVKSELELTDGAVQLTFRPFEIKTLRVIVGNSR
jgi:alpha-mannosidase